MCENDGYLRIDLWRISLHKACAGGKNLRDGKGNVGKTQSMYRITKPEGRIKQ